MKQGFTLLELIIVVIIIGILGTLGFAQYTIVIERSRTAEAKANLPTLRQLQLGYHERFSGYASVSVLLGSDLPSVASDSFDCPAGDYYYGYYCDSGSGGCRANRCTSGGKYPPATTSHQHYIVLSIDGTYTGTPGYY